MSSLLVPGWSGAKNRTASFQSETKLQVYQLSFLCDVAFGGVKFELPEPDVQKRENTLDLVLAKMSDFAFSFQDIGA